MHAPTMRLLAPLALLILPAPSTAARDDDQGPGFRPEADRNGILELPATRATLVGDRLRLAEWDEPAFVTDWASTGERVRWDFELDNPGRFVVLVEYAAPEGGGGATFEVVAADQTRQGVVHATGGRGRFLPQPMKEPVDLPAGAVRLGVRAIEAPSGLVMDLRRVRLVPAEG